MAKKRGLGRGLEALLSDGVQLDTPAAGEQVLALPLTSIHPGRYQPRSEFDPEALAELAASIKAQGVVQPIVVRAGDKRGEYELVAGERRWRASQLAELTTIPAIVRDIPDRAALAIGLIENIQRESLNPMDEAQALRRLIDECGLTHEQCAEAVGRSRATVTNLLRLVNLDEEVKRMLQHGELEMGHARALLGLPTALQAAAAGKILQQGLSVRQAESLVRQMNAPKPTTPPKAELEDRLQLERDRLAERIKARISVKAQASGKGSLVIHFGSASELQAIFDRLG